MSNWVEKRMAERARESWWWAAAFVSAAVGLPNAGWFFADGYVMAALYCQAHILIDATWHDSEFAEQVAAFNNHREMGE